MKKFLILSMLLVTTVSHAQTFQKLSGLKTDITIQSPILGKYEFRNPNNIFGSRVVVYDDVESDRQTVKNCLKNCSDSVELVKLILETAGKTSGVDQIDFINNAVNSSITYASDFSIHGKYDEWSSPLKTLGKVGDCEDYAIAKQYLLEELGHDRNKMRIVVLNLADGTFHAVLGYNLNSKWIYLDNRLKRIATDEDYRNDNAIATIHGKDQFFLAKVQ